MSRSAVLSRTIPFMLALALPVGAPAQTRPQALENAERLRESFRTGRVDILWSGSLPGPGGARSTRVYTAQFGEGSDAQVFRGDESGQTYSTDGSINRLWRGFRTTLKIDGQTWVYDGDGLTAMLSEPNAPHREGISPIRRIGLGVDGWLPGRGTRPDGQSYRESVEDGLYVVSADTDYGTLTWYIDAERGWNPVRVTLTRDGRIQQESRTTLRQWDSVWFPATVEFFGPDGAGPLETITVTSAAFNRPDQPRVVTPREIGVEAGMNIEATMADGSFLMMRFDGEKAVSMDEFGARIRAGEIKYGPTFLRELARLEAARRRPKPAETAASEPPAGNAASTATQPTRQLRESEWEAYTRRFIEKFRLDDAQTQKALSILRDCQAQADAHIVRHAAEFDKFQKRAEEADGLSPALKADRVAALEAEYAKLTAPLNEIFDKQLKPRLDKLPTRAQRKAVEGEPAMPASKPSAK